MAGRRHPAAEATLVGSPMGHPEFFSFGTNDLTEMTFGFSHDDIGGFVPDYLEPIARLTAAQAELTHPRGAKAGSGVRGQGSVKTKAKAKAKAAKKKVTAKVAKRAFKPAPKPKGKTPARKKVAAQPARKAAKAKVVAKPMAKAKPRTKPRR